MHNLTLKYRTERSEPLGFLEPSPDLDSWSIFKQAALPMAPTNDEDAAPAPIPPVWATTPLQVTLGTHLIATIAFDRVPRRFWEAMALFLPNDVQWQVWVQERRQLHGGPQKAPFFLWTIRRRVIHHVRPTVRRLAVQNAFDTYYQGLQDTLTLAQDLLYDDEEMVLSTGH